MGFELHLATYVNAKQKFRWLQWGRYPTFELAQRMAERKLRHHWWVRARITGPDGAEVYLP